MPHAATLPAKGIKLSGLEEQAACAEKLHEAQSGGQQGAGGGGWQLSGKAVGMCPPVQLPPAPLQPMGGCCAAWRA